MAATIAIAGGGDSPIGSLALLSRGSALRGAPADRQDEVYRGSDGRYYCRRSDGTTGLVIGAGVGALVGRGIDTRGERTTGTVVGGVLGALIGREVERNQDIRCR